MMTAGFTAILSNPVTILLIFMGVAIGIVFGSIPGLTATMAVTMFLPITYTMSPIAGIALLIGLYIGGTSGGLISARQLLLRPVLTDGRWHSRARHQRHSASAFSFRSWVPFSGCF